MTITGSVTAGLQTISMSGEGDFRNDPNLGDLTMSVTGAGHRFSMREVLRGTALYMTSDAFAGRLPDGKTWLKLDLAKGLKALGVDVSSLSQSPTQTLTRLQAMGSVTKIGPATVGGIATTRYSAILDLTKLPKAVRELNVSYAPVDVWVDGQGLVRKLHLAAVQGGGSQGLPQSTMDMTMTISNYGEPVAVDVPAADETYDMTGIEQQLFTKK